MRGLGRASSAITIVNALPTGVGCALGIDLYAEAEVTIREESEQPGAVEVEPAARTPLTLTTLRTALDRFAVDASVDARLTVRSEIPSARGLKSSSAVSSAIVLAVADAVGAHPAPTEVARLSAEASRSAGVSATGAFDDALAGLLGGFVVTDNARCERLSAAQSGADWTAALFVPEATHSASPGWAEAFRRHDSEAQVAVDAALRGDWWTAMRLNSELVERTMGYSYRPLRDRLIGAGAFGAGVTGLGPALAAIGPTSDRDRLRSALPVEGGRRLSIPVRKRGLRPPGGVE